METSHAVNLSRKISQCLISLYAFEEKGVKGVRINLWKGMEWVESDTKFTLCVENDRICTLRSQILLFSLPLHGKIENLEDITG